MQTIQYPAPGYTAEKIGGKWELTNTDWSYIREFDTLAQARAAAKFRYAKEKAKREIPNGFRVFRYRKPNGDRPGFRYRWAIGYGGAYPNETVERGFTDKNEALNRVDAIRNGAV